MTTHRADYRCTVKEYPSGRVFLALEPMGGKSFAAFIGFDIALDFRESVTVEQAESVAKSLNLVIAGITVTDR